MLERLPPQKSIAPGLGDIQEQVQACQNTAHHILDDFNYVSRLANRPRLTIQDLRLILDDLEKDLACREAELVNIGDAYVDFRNRIERLNNIARSTEQVAASEEELGRVRKSVEEQADLLKQDFL